MHYYQKSDQETISLLKSSNQGLTKEEVDRRLLEDGYNELTQAKATSSIKLFIDAFKDAMVVVLLVAATVQMILSEYVEAAVIMIVIIMNAVIGVIQTKKAESSLDALRKMSAPNAKVLRNHEKQTIPARELVKGDIVYLEAGDYVPSDGRLLEASSLQVNEGMLTGESQVVNKTVTTITDTVALGDQLNLVFSSALVTNGRATYIVTETGQTTEIGKIANLLNMAEQKQTPLQRKLDLFSRKLGFFILLLSVAIFSIQALRIWLSGDTTAIGTELLDALMFAVAIAVAAIPEALQSIVTIVLSVGTNKMAKQHAIIRKLPAVETLGSTKIICTDKTGTLTQNKMTVMHHFTLSSNEPSPLENLSETERLLVDTAVLCNDAYLDAQNNEVGDPTEVALVLYANKAKCHYDILRKTYTRLSDVPFDSERKVMSTLNDYKGKKTMFIKGGPDVIFTRASHVLVDGQVEKITAEHIEKLNKQNEDYAKKALRVLAFGYKELSESKTDISYGDERDFVLVGLLAMIDPPREAVYQAIKETKKAGITTIMITGDHKTTAEAIARDIGIFDEGALALTGTELDRLTDMELEEQLEHVRVYARVSPENKIRIVKAWQKKGNICAMTGDGVNDAPALKQADIGVAMGSGTDVSKDAAAMILTDDNFVSIVNAVKVGRTVFDNIKKAIAYLFSGNFGAIMAILFAVIVGLPNPFTALQLLFINLVNDSLPAIALGMEQSEPDVMRKAPREINEGIFAGGMLRFVLMRGALIGVFVIWSHLIGLKTSEELGVAMAFTTLILARTLQTFAARSNKQTIISVGFLTNKYVLGAVGVCLLLYSLTVIPAVRSIFSIPASFDFENWLTAALLALVSVVCMELIKLLIKKEVR